MGGSFLKHVLGGNFSGYMSDQILGFLNQVILAVYLFAMFIFSSGHRPAQKLLNSVKIVRKLFCSRGKFHFLLCFSDAAFVLIDL